MAPSHVRQCSDQQASGPHERCPTSGHQRRKPSDGCQKDTSPREADAPLLLRPISNHELHDGELEHDECKHPHTGEEDRSGRQGFLECYEYGRRRHHDVGEHDRPCLPGRTSARLHGLVERVGQEGNGM